MKNSLYIFSFLLIVFYSNNSISQINDEKFFGQDFIPLYDSLIQPPLNCEEAFNNTIYDSLKNELILSDKLQDQYEMIVNLYNEFESESLKSEENKFAVPEGPGGIQFPGSGPPQNGTGPPGYNANTPDDVQEIMEDMYKTNLIMDKIIVNTEKYKNELKKSVSKLNDELKSTLQKEYSERVIIANNYLLTQNTEYKKYYVLFRNNMLKIRNVVSKYSSDKYLKFPPLKNDILRLQTATMSNLKFLITITKEFTLTGAKFYSEEKSG